MPVSASDNLPPVAGAGQGVLPPVAVSAPAPPAAAAFPSPLPVAPAPAPPVAVQQIAPPQPTQPQVVSTASGAKDGVTKCPRCGSSDIVLNPMTGMLHCNYCHTEWSAPADSLTGDVHQLSGTWLGSGAQDIIPGTDVVMTFKCSACGAEVVVDTREALQARCHWCRNTLSVNQQIPNGAVPDIVLPFRLTKEQAQHSIEAFVGKRRFYAHPRFRQEFTTANIMGVYLPYMVVDIKSHVRMAGQGEHLVRRYTVGSGDNRKTRYDADLYDIARDFDLLIDDLTVEASTERLQQTTSVNSNNIINTILPFPLEAAVQFNANYLRGYTSEKRDANRDALSSLVQAQSRDIARTRARSTTIFYDRGVRWESLNLEVSGQLWKTAYLPVWLYSYLEIKGSGKKFLHYVAVNGVTGETMGSVPIHTPKLVAVSAVIEIIGAIVGLAVVLLFV
ncbi:MAG: TFIIB-type zinc ribbon-containing protein [Coriobacteriales bacterium]|jgi:transcription elongation factor Elf1|nr:TFIIB-type zinc ribbon-containing protein [Coriobacteriales bacterium]